jgi:hypothetical protein
MVLRNGGQAIPALLVLAACGAGTPMSAGEATEKLREEFSDDEYTVTWLNVVERDEPGDFRAFIDRVKKNDAEATETQLCNASLTSNSTSWNCQAARPSIMVQAANLLIEDYRSREIEVRAYHLARTGKGNAFTGYFELVEPNSRQSLRVPCKGDQVELNFDIDCDLAYGEAGTET